MLRSIQFVIKIIIVLLSTSILLPIQAQFSSVTNFETDLGIWQDGGSDAYRLNTTLLSGNYCMRLRDNSYQASSIITPSLNLANVDKVIISFDYYPESMEPGEDFFFEYSSNGGQSYEIIKKYISGTDFQNGQKYAQTFTVERLFSNISKFRFRCDASSNYDRIYLDNIVVVEDQDCYCPQVYDPVCGVDGNTYGNACEAGCAGVAVAYNGECNNLQQCEDLLATVDFGDLCAQCVSQIDLYEYQGTAYLVYLPDNVNCSDFLTEVRTCTGDVVFCRSGGIAGLNECDAFFASATKIRTVVSQDCGAIRTSEGIGKINQSHLRRHFPVILILRPDGLWYLD